MYRLIDAWAKIMSLYRQAMAAAAASLALATAGASRPSPRPSLLAEMQALEGARNLAIKSGDLDALRKIYAEDFRGINAAGLSLGRDDLFGIFKRSGGGPTRVESVVEGARFEGRIALVYGRLRIRDAEGKLLSESLYLHIFRRTGSHWQMIAGSSVPAA